MREYINILLIVTALAIVSCSGGKVGGKKEESKKDDSKTIITIGDEKYTLADLMYYVYSEEETGALYSQVYEQFYGTDYWETKIEENDNKTGEKVAKDNIPMFSVFKPSLPFTRQSL